jgi:hypothetical protein
MVVNIALIAAVLSECNGNETGAYDNDVAWIPKPPALVKSRFIIRICSEHFYGLLR